MIEGHDGQIWFVTTGCIDIPERGTTLKRLTLSLKWPLHNFEDHTKTKWITGEVHGIFKFSRGKIKQINSNYQQHQVVSPLIMKIKMAIYLSLRQMPTYSNGK